MTGPTDRFNFLLVRELNYIRLAACLSKHTKQSLPFSSQAFIKGHRRCSCLSSGLCSSYANYLFQAHDGSAVGTADSVGRTRKPANGKASEIQPKTSRRMPVLMKKRPINF